MRRRLWITMMSLLAIATHANEPTYRVFVSNEKDDTISVIDTRTNTLETTITVGKRPRGIGLAPDGSELYVALSAENTIAVIDPASLQLLRSFSSGDDPEAFDVHANGNIYISNEEDAKASVYNPRNGDLLAEIPVGIEPEGVTISPDGSIVGVTSESSSMLHIITIPDHYLVGNVLVGARPRSLTFSHDGSSAYVTSEINGEITRIDTSSFVVTGKGRLGEASAKPKDILFNADGSKLYVAGGRADKVFVLDPETLMVENTIGVGKRVWGLAMTRDGKRLYTSNGVSGTVSVIDTDTDRVITTISVGKFPWGLAIDD